MSVALCGQGFGFELLDRMLGLDCGCCEPAACKPAACEPAVCEPAACEPAACEPDACGPCGKSKCRDKCRRATPVRDLFSGLQDLLDCKKGCGKSCGQKGCCEPAAACCEPAAACCEPVAACCEPVAACCEPVACKPAACEPAACEPAACEPAACEPDACEPCGAKCGKKKSSCRRPLLDLLDGIFGCCKSKGCGKSACCEPAGCGGCGGCGEAEAADAAGNGAEAPGELPRAPDPSASLQRTRGIYQASIARN